MNTAESHLLYAASIESTFTANKCGPTSQMRKQGNEINKGPGISTASLVGESSEKLFYIYRDLTNT